MKILPSLKIVGAAFLTLGIAVGCASQQQQPEHKPMAMMNHKAQDAKAAIAAKCAA